MNNHCIRNTGRQKPHNFCLYFLLSHFTAFLNARSPRKSLSLFLRISIAAFSSLIDVPAIPITVLKVSFDVIKLSIDVPQFPPQLRFFYI